MDNTSAPGEGGAVFDQGLDPRIPVAKLQIEMFLYDHKDQSIIEASKVRDFLLDILLELGK